MKNNFFFFISSFRIYYIEGAIPRIRQLDRIPSSDMLQKESSKTKTANRPNEMPREPDQAGRELLERKTKEKADIPTSGRRNAEKHVNRLCIVRQGIKKVLENQFQDCRSCQFRGFRQQFC